VALATVPAVFGRLAFPRLHAAKLVRRVPPKPPTSASSRLQVTARFSMRYVSSILLTFILLLCAARSADARLQFYQEYKKMYLESHPDKKYVAEVDKGMNKCFVCHQGRKSKKNRNPFGQLLAEQFGKKKNEKDKKKIDEAIKKIAEAHVNAKDKKSETYVDRIKASKWPAGELKQLMEEPKDEKKDEKKEGK
jgi:cytochrome c2